MKIIILARKIKITVVSEDRDKAYDFLRHEVREQNKALNAAMNHLYFNHVARDKIKLADESYVFKEKKHMTSIEKKYTELKTAKTDKKKKDTKDSITKEQATLEALRKGYNKQSNILFKEAILTNEKTNLRDFINNSYNLKSDTIDNAVKRAMQDFSNDIKEVLRGERTLRRYKKDNPLYVRGRALKFSSNDKDEYFIKWINGVIFKCILGTQKQNSLELQTTLERILDNKYDVKESSIEFYDNKLILNLCLDIPAKTKSQKISGRIVGVDLGMKVPAYCALSDSDYIRKGIGSIDDFLKVRLQMQKRRRNLQRALKSARGGHGREKKLSALNQFTNKEKNFAKTYNHFLSHNIINFAKQYQAEQINLELLSLAETQDKSLLRNWSYYQLQQFIEYKAKKEGILVAYVDPYHTSQTCSKCGHYEEGQRLEQAIFKCKNPECNFEANADFNAAMNIAKSTKYINDKSQSEYYKKEEVVYTTIEQLDMFE